MKAIHFLRAKRILWISLAITGTVIMTLPVTRAEGPDRPPIETEASSPPSAHLQEGHPHGKSTQAPAKEPGQDAPSAHEHSGMSKDPARPASPHDHTAMAAN